VKKKITSDMDSAKKILQKFLDLNEKLEFISKDDFYQVFCKCIFKDSLLAMTDEIDKLDKGLGDIPLTVKLGQY